MASLFFTFSQKTNRPGRSFSYSDSSDPLITRKPKTFRFGYLCEHAQIYSKSYAQNGAFAVILLAFDFPSSGDVGDDTFPKLYERNLMSEYFERLIYQRTVKNEHSIKNHKLSNQLSMTETFIEIQSEKC